MTKIRTRYAPSPTGKMHVGNLRTALYAYLIAKHEDGDYILFGKETKGLPEELLIKNPERCVRIPMQGEIRSLNLSNSVAIAVYEALRQWNYPALENFGQLHNYKWEDIC